MPPRSGERGFTLVEILVATGVWIVLGGTLLYLTQGLLSDAKLVAERQSAYTELTHLLEVWESEATSSLAIFVPATDVLGFDNSDGHELDFYSRDAARQGHFWAYRWDAKALTLQRYTYSVRGGPAAPSDPPVAGITALSAVRVPASTLSRPFLAGYVPRDVVVNFGYPDVNGGNAITDVTVASARNRFEIELLPGTMASGFGVIVGTFQRARATASRSSCFPGRWHPDSGSSSEPFNRRQSRHRPRSLPLRRPRRQRRESSAASPPASRYSPKSATRGWDSSQHPATRRAARACSRPRHCACRNMAAITSRSPPVRRAPPATFPARTTAGGIR